MPLQHTIPSQIEPHLPAPAWHQDPILVPLGLPSLQIISQTRTAEGQWEVTILSSTDRAACPRCGRFSPKPHDHRLRRKREVSLGGGTGVLLLWKRRFRCLACRRPFTEPDTICGWRRRTTARLREAIGAQACSRPIAHVAAELAVGPRLLPTGLQRVAQTRLSQPARTLEAPAPRPSPPFRGSDDFARRQGQPSATILCDREARRGLARGGWSHSGRGASLAGTPPGA